MGITRKGKWYHYSGDFENIRQDTWWKDEKHLALSIVSQDPSLAVFWFLRRRVEEGAGGSGLSGAARQRTGEDGTVQGFLRWRIFRWWDAIPSPRLFVWIRTGHIFLPMRREFPSEIRFLWPRADREAGKGEIAAKLRCPIFVKPLRAGSSFGITKISSMEELENALDLAFANDDWVIAEEAWTVSRWAAPFSERKS